MFPDPEHNKKTLYWQEGPLSIYPVLHPAIAGVTSMSSFFRNTFEDIWLYFKDKGASMLWVQERMELVAKEFIQHSDFPEEFKREWTVLKKQLLESSRNIHGLDISALTKEQLLENYRALHELHMRMWSISIFIDAFDPGYDQEQIQKLAGQHGLSEEEIDILLTPTQGSFIQEMHNALHQLKQERISRQDFINDYFWAASNYSGYGEVDDRWIDKHMETAEYSEFRSPEKGQQRVLALHNLDRNPLQMFQTLTVWRDERKMVNYFGLYGLMRLRAEGLARNNIPRELVVWLLTTELEDVFDGKMDQTRLLERKDNPVLVHFTKDGYAHLMGDDAEKEFNRLVKFVPFEKELKGATACKGNVRGIVRIVSDFAGEEAKQFREGEILVTSMTRPEFVTLMRRSAAIITNEGGISCHAAIVSREMSKPCIIGTRHATRVLKDGDLVEVDADNGVVRIIENAANAQ